MVTETFIIKETNLIKETVTLYFDKNDNIVYTVRKLNDNITSVQNNKGKFLSKKDFNNFKN